MVTRTSASVPESPSETPRACSQPAKGSDRVLAPNAAEKKPANVTPTWTAARNWLGSLSSFCTACPRRPLSAIARTCDSRRETRAISAPEKTPPIRTKTTTMTMLSQTSLTGGVLLGGSWVGACGPHGAWSGSTGASAQRPAPSPGCRAASEVTFLSGTHGDLARTVSLGRVTNRDRCNSVRSERAPLPRRSPARHPRDQGIEPAALRRPPRRRRTAADGWRWASASAPW